jgi:DNA adenine methylase
MSKIQKIIESIESEKIPNQITSENIELVKSKSFDFVPPKPLLKWVGGKTQILEKIIGEFPTNIKNYHEIFIGGGSVLFALLHLIKTQTITITGTINAYDLNPDLINMYKIVQTQPKKLFNEITKIINKYNDIDDNDEVTNKKPQNDEEGLSSKESYYYWIRKQYNTKPEKPPKNKDLIKNAAMFIFLNKTCFRGLYRTGPNGFNVPYGNYKNPTIIDKNHLIEISQLIANVNFHNLDFSKSLKQVQTSDFVYMDPPYAPENDTSFIGYTDAGFDIKTHEKLFTISNEFKNTNKYFIMSNADVKLVRDNFPNFKIESIDCKRSINSKNPGAKTKEVIIKSF